MSTEATGRARAVVTPAQISEILATKAGVDPEVFAGNDQLSLRDLEIDSLAVLELQAVILESFGVEIPENAIDMTVGEIAGVVTEGAGEVR